MYYIDENKHKEHRYPAARRVSSFSNRLMKNGGKKETRGKIGKAAKNNFQFFFASTSQSLCPLFVGIFYRKNVLSAFVFHNRLNPACFSFFSHLKDAHFSHTEKKKNVKD